MPYLVIDHPVPDAFLRFNRKSKIGNRVNAFFY
jgi:hypothetical protein